MSINKPIKISALAFAITLSSLEAHADVQAQLDSMFSNMTNVTAPGAYETASRGVLSGGSFRTRNQIATAPLFTFRPPSAQAGCGGIDMFAGSFSFINAQQFVQSLRSIASNAVGVASGYAFQLALNAMSQMTGNVIESLQNKMQALNQMFSNSCQLAQGLVTNTFDALGVQKSNNEGNKSIMTGLADVFGSKSPSDTNGKSASEKLDDAGLLEFCKDKGNILWCEMQRKGVSSTFMYGGRETQEVIMSLTGSIYVGDLVQADDGKGKSNQTLPIPPTGISIRDLIQGKKGEKVTIYDCSGDPTACSSGGASIPTKQIEIVGMGSKIVTAFNGDAGSAASPGIIWKWAHNQGPFTAEEKAIIGSLNAIGISAEVQRISQKSEDMARGFVAENANSIARQAVFSLAESYLLSASNSIVGSTLPYVATVQKQIQQGLLKIRSENTDLIKEFGNSKDMLTHYQTLMQIMPSAPAYQLSSNNAIEMNR